MEQELCLYIKNLYLKENKTMKEIQDITGIDRKKISLILKQQNIQSRYRISESQLEIAITMYEQGKNFTEIAKQINCDRHCIATKLREYGIAKTFKKVITPTEQQVIKEYQEGYDMKTLSNKYLMSYKTVQELIRSEKIKRHTTTKCNTDIFKVIDTEEKAYWLGFLYADGYVNNKGVELTLQAKDIDHIKKFKTFMKSDHKISYKENVNAYRICISSQEIAQDLIKLGCYQCKSLTLQFPTRAQVASKYMHHFMRGYFDGDGCVSINLEKKYYHFSVLGTDNFIDRYDDILMAYLNKVKQNKKVKCGKAFGIQYGGKLQLTKIYNFLYKDATIYLERKFQKFAVLRSDHKES